MICRYNRERWTRTAFRLRFVSFRTLLHPSSVHLHRCNTYRHLCYKYLKTNQSQILKLYYNTDLCSGWQNYRGQLLNSILQNIVRGMCAAPSVHRLSNSCIVCGKSWKRALNTWSVTLGFFNNLS